MITPEMFEKLSTNDLIGFNKEFVAALHKSTWTNPENINVIARFVLNWLKKDEWTNKHLLSELWQLDYSLNAGDWQNAKGLLELIVQYWLFNR